MNAKIYLIVSLILVLTSCEIRGPEEKPDFAKPGKQMFYYSEQNLNRMCDLFDITLKLNTFIQSPDSLKPVIKLKYLDNYSIKQSADLSTWYLYNENDTVYTIKTDSHPLTTEGTVWILQSYGLDSCSVYCSQKNHWQFVLSNSMYYYMGSEADLQFNCTDSLSPVDYYSSNYLIEGTCNTQIESYSQDVFINCSTINKLEHKANSHYNFSGGSLLLSAHELEDTNEHIVTAEYNNVTDNKRTITIIYDGKLKTYNDL